MATREALESVIDDVPGLDGADGDRREACGRRGSASGSSCSTQSHRERDRARTVHSPVRSVCDRLAAVDEVGTRAADRDLDRLGEDGREADREEEAEPAVVPVPERAAPDEGDEEDEDGRDHAGVDDALAKRDALLGREGVLDRRVGERELALVAGVVGEVAVCVCLGQPIAPEGATPPGKREERRGGGRRRTR